MKFKFSLITCLAAGLIWLQMPQATAESAQSSSPGHLKIALALGGGGTRGLAHVGVLRELEKAGIHPDFICGTSMGAIVGAFYAAGKTPDEINTIVCKKDFIHSYDTVPIPVRICLIPMFFVPHLFGWHPYDGLYRGNKFAKFVSNCVDSNLRNLENLKIPFWSVSSNLLDGSIYCVKTGDIGRAVQASSAVPGLRRPLYWQNQLLVDGGVICNVPVEQAKQMGADYVIAVDVDEPLGVIPADHFRKIGSVAYRCLNLQLAKIDEPQLKQADFVIHPDVAGIEIMSRRQKDMQEAMVRGEKAARESIESLKLSLRAKSAQLAGTMEK